MSHPVLMYLPSTEAVQEILKDRENLEALCGYVVRGMSYPHGVYSDYVVRILKACGIEYCRTIEATNGFYLPADFLKWHPTCHYHEAMTNIDRFLDMLNDSWRSGLLYIWGHSFEFDSEEKWEQMERCCAKLADKKERIWFATNIEICDYKTAQSRLRVSANGKRIENPSTTDVWVIYNCESIKIPGGEAVWTV